VSRDGSEPTRAGGDRRDFDAPAVRLGTRFADASRAARLLIVGTVAAAVGLAVLHSWHADLPIGIAPVAVVALLLVASVGNVELGRWLEGRVTVEQRPHKSLSVWAYACAVILAPVWLLVIVPLTYGHAYWRGIRPPAWKWVGSASFVVLAGVAAHFTVFALCGDDVLTNSARDLLALVAGIGAFLATESLLFFAVSRLNHPEQERWLRATLAEPSFYLTEIGMLCVGALTFVIWTRLAWFAVLLIPAYGLLQQAALFDPLRREAARDDKTGLLRWEPWRARARLLTEELRRAGRSWAVIMLDLDHFASFNEIHGHMAADDVLVQVAQAIEANVRSADLVCRFGGEEFAVLLVDATAADALFIAQRLLVAIARTSRPTVTASLGVASVTSSADDGQLPHALIAADRALYDAKNAGRNRVIVHLVAS
jgi:diguanylate cyclase (GGDEF)-like protein